MPNIKIKANNLESGLKSVITNSLLSKLRDRLEEGVRASIPSEIVDDPPINIDVTYNANPSEGTMQFTVRAESELVRGIKETQVSGSIYRSHIRVLEGQRNFFTGSGFITSDRVPEVLLKKIVEHGIQAVTDPNAHKGHSLDEHARQI